MIDFSLSDEDAAVINTVRQFVEREVMPFEAPLLRREVEQGRSGAGLTRDELKTLQAKGQAIGLWGTNTPEDCGGTPLSPLLQALISIELGRTFVRFRIGGNVPSVLFHANDEQKQDYTLPAVRGERLTATAISEPGGGSDVRAMRTSARRDGDDFVIDGEKMWITGASDADFLTVFARTPDDGGGITGFLVDRDMGWTSKDIPLIGSSPVATVNFDNVRVPKRNVIGEVNQGFRLLIDWIYENRLMLLAPRNVGTCERLIGMAVEWASNRSTFGKPLRERENIAFWIAESEIDVRASKVLVLNGAWKAAQGEDYRQEAYVAKAHSARVANQVVDRVLQIHGGMGYAMEMPIQRWFRDLRVERIYEGSDEMNLASIARNLFRRNMAPGQIN